MGGYLDPALTWADLAWLRGLVPGWMKLGVKGVQSVEVGLSSLGVSFLFIYFYLVLNGVGVLGRVVGVRSRVRCYLAVKPWWESA
jgi:hypothetical protein